MIESSKSSSCKLSNIVYCAHENPSQVEKLDKINPDTNLIKYEDLSSDTPLSAPVVAGTDLAVIMYTSGTTGTWFTVCCETHAYSLYGIVRSKFVRTGG